MKETEDRRVAAVEEKDQIEWLVDMVGGSSAEVLRGIGVDVIDIGITGLA